MADFTEVNGRRWPADDQAADEIERLRARLEKAEFFIKDTRASLIHLNRQVSTFGIAATILERLDAFLADQPSVSQPQWIPCECGYAMPPGFENCVKCGKVLADKGSLADELRANGMKPKPPGRKP